MRDDDNFFTIQLIPQRNPLGRDYRLREWILDLIERNVASWYPLPSIFTKLFDSYKRSLMGWNKTCKCQELSQPSMNFFLARNQQGEMIGVGALLQTIEPSLQGRKRPVGYIYELQVVDEWQGQGVGTSLLTTMEQHIKQTFQCPLAMLTCFRENKAALRFYYRHGFVIDETSPKNMDYVVLSKRV